LSYWAALDGALVGAGLTIQVGMNATVRFAIGSPVLAAIVNFVVGPRGARRRRAGQRRTLDTRLGGGRPRLGLVRRLPRAPTSPPRPCWARARCRCPAGAHAGGQMVAALIVDHYGVIGFPQSSVTPARLLGAACCGGCAAHHASLTATGGTIMARTPSTMLALGTRAPDFSLPTSAAGNTPCRTWPRRRRCSSRSSATTVRSCDTCEPGLLHSPASTGRAGSRWSPSTRTTSTPTRRMVRTPCGPRRRNSATSFPTSWTRPRRCQGLSRRVHADFFLFDAQRRLVYRGASSTTVARAMGVPSPARPACSGSTGRSPGTRRARTSLPSLGCNIKWRPGNEPDYGRA